MVSAVADHLGVGIYSPAEAAFYARERTGTVTRWLFGTKKDEPVLSSQLDASEKLVTFLDFIQLLAIADIRRQYGVPLQTIRQGVEKAKQVYGVAYPFAMEHKTYLFERREGGLKEKDDDKDAAENDEGKRRFEIVIRVGDASLVQVTGPKADNYMLKEVVELYLRDLGYDPKGIAKEYHPWRDGNLKITMDPHRHFGEPLTPSCYTAVALAEAVTAEGGIDRAAKAYGVDPKEVELAFRYVTSLQSPPRGK